MNTKHDGPAGTTDGRCNWCGQTIDADQIIIDLVIALKGMMPMNTGYCNSMDWHRYDAAVAVAKAVLAKALKVE